MQGASRALAARCKGALRWVAMKRVPGVLLWAGLALFVLGAGNWWVGSQKVQEHAILLAQFDGATGVVPHEDFPNLSATTNRGLLQAFRIPFGRAAATRQKVEFYRTVEFGGRVLMLLGMLALVLSLILSRRKWTGGRFSFLRAK